MKELLCKKMSMGSEEKWAPILAAGEPTSQKSILPANMGNGSAAGQISLTDDCSYVSCSCLSQAQIQRLERHDDRDSW